MKQEISDLQKQVTELQSNLTEERVSNLELDQTHKEQTQKIEELTDLLATEKLKNQQLSQQLQELRIESDEVQLQFKEQIVTFQQYIASQQQQIVNQRQIINQQHHRLQEMSSYINNNHTHNHNDEEEEFGKYDIKFEDDQKYFNVQQYQEAGTESETSETNKELRHRLLEEQMKYEQLKHVHRESITKLEQYELDQLLEHEAANNGNPNANGNANANGSTSNQSQSTSIREVNEQLRNEVEALRQQLEDERKKRENLDKERRNSLAALSQNMFKKLLDSEHQHYDDKSDLERQCDQLKLIVKHLEKSKQALLKETSKTIDDLRDHIKFLSTRLQKYENW
eukprot:CAMPEP_0197074104 /NCGR_PEP_ID=MMETSP1384-20130603/210942_1 /TAXON_ID=29189 /ORGANISM="Ammonia sp." /LENGTH=339 /DNA_ID=CAMNT_0042512945 /DNA_START=106 /DNA_END=1122 /DNA_ORIENTATION=+